MRRRNMSDSQTAREPFLQWVRVRHGESLHALAVRRLADEPDVESHILLNTILYEQRGGPVLHDVDLLHFCSD